MSKVQKSATKSTGKIEEGAPASGERVSATAAEAPSGNVDSQAPAPTVTTFANGFYSHGERRLSDVIRFELAFLAKFARSLTDGVVDQDAAELQNGIVSLLALTTDVDALEGQVTK